MLSKSFNGTVTRSQRGICLICPNYKYFKLIYIDSLHITLFQYFVHFEKLDLMIITNAINVINDAVTL